MINFDTEGLQPHERFDHWCEARARGLFGVTIELERELRLDFHGRFAAYPFGGATIAEMKASSYRVSRTWADIARMPGDSLYISQQVRGPGALYVGDEHVHHVKNGGMVVSYSDLPTSAIPERTDGFHYRAIKIPVTDHARLRDSVRNLLAQPLAPDHYLTALIDASFGAILARRIAPEHAEDAIGCLAHLTLLARGCVAERSHASRGALRHGYLQLALKLIAQSLPRPDLSPAQIARTLGISVRQLHLLFEPTGMSFARTLLAMRLEEARRQIEAMPNLTIAQISAACGFDSPATFYRTFRRAYDATPRDLRTSPR